MAMVTHVLKVLPKKKRIILLGGSFNPAHEGHVHISLKAMEALEADEVWWLLSPQNPHKDADDMADYDVRYQHALALTKETPIHVSRFEQEHDLTYSVDTISALKETYDHEFIWLMGSDNLMSFHKWRDWEGIIDMLPIAVYDRTPFEKEALESEAGKYLSQHILPLDLAVILDIETPALIMLHFEMHPESGTRLRKTLGKKAFLAHNS